ncbi:APC family permease [Rummeliibacillus sp. NPDC094406]|uniref:APC family permease n=1 Tax=Rummeliibacillus sp. NPDC094406 TaxID=3364511 RepID=UPI003830A959
MEDQKLLKILGNRDVMALAFGAMIGWGWVVTAGLWITGAGSLGAIISFLFGGILVIFIGLAYAELASAMPLSGGELYFSYKALGRQLSFIATWAMVLGYVSVVAFEAVALPTVFEYVVPGYSKGYMYTISGWDVNFTWVAVGVIGSIIMAFINYRGMKVTSVVMSILTLVILISGVLLVTGSSIAGDVSNMKPLFVDGWGGIMVVLIMTPFMFVGFDVIPQTAEEINLPRKRIGQLLIISVLLAIIWYVGIIFGVSYMLTPAEIAKSNLVTADAMAKAFGNSKMMGNILVLGGIGGILTSWLGFYVGGSRAIFALAKAGMLPKSLGELHPKYKTPHKAILLIAVLTTLAPLFGRPALVWLVDAGGMALVVAWVLVACAFITLRKREPNLKRPFKVPGGTLVGWIAIILSVGVLALYMPGMPSALVWPYEWVIIIAWAAFGAILYKYSMKKYGAENANKIMDKEINRILAEEDIVNGDKKNKQVKVFTEDVI